MLSMPPAATILKSPQRRSLAAIITARMPEPQTLLRVMAPVAGGQPAPRAAWRAGACPWPAVRTQPMLTCCTSWGDRAARSMAAARARAPRACAGRPESAPWKVPIGVRTALKMTTSSMASPVSRWGELLAAIPPLRQRPADGTRAMLAHPFPQLLQLLPLRATEQYAPEVDVTMRSLSIDFGEKRTGLPIT